MKLPLAETPYPASVGVFDTPIKKSEYMKRVRDLPQFLTEVATKFRHVRDMLGNMSMREVDGLVMLAYTPSEPAYKRAEAAWKAIAWHRIHKPMSHANRSHHIDVKRLFKIVELDAQALYMYALLIENEPSGDIHGRMKTLNKGMADAYFEYAANFVVLRHNVPAHVVEWIFSPDAG